MRRKVVLLVVAVVIAAMGASLVLLYVNGLSDKAQANEDLVNVLTVTETIDRGEEAGAAQSAGKGQYFLYAGTSTNRSTSKGIYVYRYDSTNGKTEPL